MPVFESGRAQVEISVLSSPPQAACIVTASPSCSTRVLPSASKSWNATLRRGLSTNKVDVRRIAKTLVVAARDWSEKLREL
mmetsp:Transcript_19618/g.63719  ORF Transcript_19618/g.63719 Transcript_19618/m.63719 type:complete len:81 (+) Transcript_19618:2312-2554(+)